MWRALLIVALLLIGAFVLHKSFCEWRRFEYLESDAARFAPRLMLGLDEEHMLFGNATRWDAELARFARYNALWFECLEQENPTWAEDPKAVECFARLDFPTDTPALRAIASVRCQEERFGSVRGRAAIERCTGAKGATETHLPRFTSEIIGPRFASSYYRTFGLWAEARSPNRPVAWIAGVVLPSLLCLAAGALVYRVFARRRHSW